MGDYDNDGRLDILTTSARGGEPVLWHGRGDGTFTRDARGGCRPAPRLAPPIAAATFVDYNNDGWLDLVVVGTPRARGSRGAMLFRNDAGRGFTDRVGARCRRRWRPGTALAVSDVDQDGDEDLLVGDAGGAVHLLRNDGGNANMAVRVQLRALRDGSGKNNSFGMGARLELRVGELHQTRVVTSAATHFGLGSHLKADVLRVEWPNGVPQIVYFPGSDKDVVEIESLKGSCAFAYTWDGTRFRFVTDVMWRSALGMPLGLMAGGSGTSFAPAGASQEYLRIPGERTEAEGRPLPPPAHRGAVGDRVCRPGEAHRRGPSRFGGRLRRRDLRAARPGDAPAVPGGAEAPAAHRGGRARRRRARRRCARPTTCTCRTSCRPATRASCSRTTS